MPCNILLIQDSPSINALLKLRLTKENFSVDIAENGRQAIQKYRPHHYDFIILDYCLPDMDGAGVLGFLQKKNSSALPPIILMSASENSDEINAQIKPDYYINTNTNINDIMVQLLNYIKQKNE